MSAVLALEHQELQVLEEFEPVGVLTAKQSAFVRAYVANGGNATKAAEAAGYSNPRTAGWHLLRLPHVLAAIRAEQSRLVLGGAAKGLRWMVNALDDAKLPGAVRFQSAKWLAEAAGHGLAAQRARLGLPDGDKPLSEMTLDELDAFISAGKHAVTKLKDDRARTIEGQLVHSDARSDDVIDAQPVDSKG